MPGIASGNVDERIVEMRIDHDKFESGAKKTISILERLDAGLKSLSGQNADGFDQIADSLEAVDRKFSVFGTIGDQVLRNLTNKAMELVGQLRHVANELTLDQVGAGWNKYAEKTQGVQTIMAATAKDWEDQGAQMEWVNAQLEKLNWFTDETSYNFLEMVNNIGKFTSNGVKLETAVTSMEGISTWAALSGANANEASRAMYNLSQALATGTVKLIDWKSIENANMATREFKELALETAVSLGTLSKVGENTYKTLGEKGKEFTTEQFNTELSEGWFTSDVLLSVLNQYGKFTDVLNAASNATDLTATEMLEAVDAYEKGEEGLRDIQRICDDSHLSIEELMPWLKELSSDTYELGRRAFKAAQEAKTFQEAIDATKDAVSTAWMNVFETIFGSYLEAKEFWTDVAESLYNIFADPINQLGELVDLAFGDKLNRKMDELQAQANFDELTAGLHDLGYSFQSFEDAYRRIDGKTVDDLVSKYGSLENAIKKGAVSAKDFQDIMLMLAGTNEYISKTPVYDSAGHIKAFEPVYHKIITLTGERLAIYNKLIGASGRLTNTEESGLEHITTGSELFTEGLANMLGVIEDVTKAIDHAMQLLFGDNTDPENIIPWTDVLGEKLYGSLEKFNEFAEALRFDEEKGEIEALGEKIAAVASVFVTARNIISSVFGFLMSVVTGIMTALGQGRVIEHIFKAISNVVQGLLAPLRFFASLVQTAFETLAGEKLGNFNWVQMLTRRFLYLTWHLEILSKRFREFMESEEVALIVAAAFEKLKTVVSSIGDFFVKAFTKIKNVISIFKQGFNANGLVGGIQAVVSAIQSFLERHSVLQQAIEYIKPILSVLAGIVFLIADAFYLAFQKVKSFVDLIREGFKVNGLKGAFDSITEFVNNLLKNHPILLKVFSFMKDAFSKIGNVLSGFGGKISSLFTGFDLSKFKFDASGIKELVSTIRKNLSNVISKVDLVGAIKNVFTNIKDSISSIIDNIHIFDIIKAKLLEFKENISQWFASLNINETFSERLADIFTILKSLFLGGTIGMMLKGAHSFNELIESLSTAVWSLDKFIGAAALSFGSRALKNLAMSLLYVAVALKIISTIPKDDIALAMGVLTSLVIKLLGLMVALKAIDGFKGLKLGGLISFAISIGILAVVLWGLSKMDTRSMLKGWFGLQLLLNSVIKFTLFTGNVKKKGLGELFGVAVSIAIIAGVLKFLSTMAIGAFVKGWFLLRKLLNSIIRFTRKVSSVKNAGLWQLLALAATIASLAHTLNFLSKLRIGALLKGWLGLSAIIGQILIFTWGVKGLNGKSLNGLIIVALVVHALAQALAFLGTLKISQLLKGWLGLSLLMNQMIKFTRRSRSMKDAGLGQLILLAVSIAILVGVLTELSRLPAKRLMKGWLAISALMWSIAKFSKNFVHFKEKPFKSFLGIVIIIAAIVAAFMLLRSIPAKQLIGTAAAISLCLMAIAGATYVLNKTGKVKFSSLASVLIGVLALIGISYALNLMSNFDWERSGKTLIACVATLIAVTLAMSVLSRISVAGAAKGIAVLAIIAGGIALIAWALIGIGTAILSSAKMMAIKFSEFMDSLIPAIGKLKRLSDGDENNMDLLARILAKLAKAEFWGFVGSLFSKLSDGCAFIDGLAAMVSSLFLACIKLRKLTDADKDNVTRFASIMGSLANAQIWETIGDAISKISNKLLGAPTFVSNMGTLASTIQTSMESFRGFTSADVISIRNFSLILEALLDAEIFNLLTSSLSAIGEKLSGGQDFTEKLGAVADGMRANIDKFKGFKSKDAKEVQDFLDILVCFAKVQALELITTSLAALSEKISGGKDFTEKLAEVATGIKRNIGAFKGFSESDSTAISSFTDIMLNLAEIQAFETLSTGLSALSEKINGGSLFITRLARIADAFRTEKASFDGFTDTDADGVKNFMSVMQALTGVTFWSEVSEFISGLIDNPTFGEDFTKLAQNMLSSMLYIRQLKDDDASKIDNMNSILVAVTEATFWTKIQDWFNKWQGQGLSDMAEQLSEFSLALAPFLSFMSATPRAALENGQILADILDVFNRKAVMSSFSMEVSSFYYGLSGVDTGVVTSVLNSLSIFVNSIANLNQVLTNTDGFIGNLHDALTGIADGIISGVTAGIQTDGNSVSFETALIIFLNTSILTVSTDASIFANSQTIGSNIVNGVAAGINANAGVAISAVVSLATSINSAFASTLEIKSPSRAMARLAAYIPAGVAVGVERNSGVAVDSITVLGSSILAAMQMAMLKVATVADERFDITPVITPVVDTTNMDYAAGMAGGMFGRITSGLRGTIDVNADRADALASAANASTDKGSMFGEIQRLSDKLDSLGDALMGMQIVLDTGELVGATSPQMDAAFGTMQMRKGRGN